MDRTTSPSSQAVSSLGLRVERPPGRRRDVLGRDHVDPAVRLLAPDADDPAVPPGGRTAVAVAVEDLVDVRVRGGSRAPSSPWSSGRATGSSAAHGPGSRTGVDIVRQEPAGVAVVEGHRRRLRRRRAPAARPPWSSPATRRGRPRCRGRRSGATPPPARRTPRPRGAGSGVSPSQSPVEVQRGREIFQPPSFSPRTTAPDAASVTTTDAAHRDVGLVAALAAGDRGRRAPVGAARTSAVVSGPSCSISRRSSPRCSSAQTVPSTAMPVDSISLAIRRTCWSATRALALPQTAGRSSRGKAKTVRRIASCLTIERSA